MNNENKLIRFKSNEKNWHQQPDYQNLCNLCSPAFCIISGNVNVGKSSLCKNLIVSKNPPYERIVIYSPMGDESTEYTEDIECEVIDYIPEYSFFDKNERNLFVCEDIDPKNGLTKDERLRLSKFFSFIGSHKQVDIICITQNCTDLLPSIRRLCNICFLFKNHDVEHMTSLARKFNLRAQDLRYIFNNICTSKYDHLCIDESRDDEHRLRKNVYEIIKLPQLK